MQLKRLVITGQYKNIQTGVLEFSSCGYTALVGENGSGKSNWIEAIAAVMIHISEGREPGFSYRLVTEEGEVSYNSDTHTISFKKDDVEVAKQELMLPQRIIACYSGEDSRLWNDFFLPSYVAYFGDSIYRQYAEPTVLFLNKYHWQIALMVLLCSDNEEVKDTPLF